MPHVDLALVEYLERTCVDKFPVTQMSEYKLGFQGGQIHVIRFLRQLYEDQVKSSLTAGFAKD
jgi:hypothetical protein